MLSLSYKITSFTLTIAKISIYSGLTFCLILSLRFIRLGTELNLIVLTTKLTNFPFFIKIIMISLVCLYIYIFKSVWSLLTNQLYFELKKIHIYLQQFDSKMFAHKKSKNMLQNFLYFSAYRYLTKFFSFTHGLSYLYDDKKFSPDDIIKNYSTPELIKKNLMIYNDKIVHLYYLLKLSKYRDTVLTKSIILFIKYTHSWAVLKFLPFFIIIMVFIFEYIFNQGIIKNIFYIIFISFIYKIIIDLLQFYDNTNLQNTQYICICYYNIEEIYKSYPYIKNSELIRCYNAYTNFKYNDLIYIYMLVGLDNKLAGSIYHNYTAELEKKKKESSLINGLIWKLNHNPIMQRLHSLYRKGHNLIYPL